MFDHAIGVQVIEDALIDLRQGHQHFEHPHYGLYVTAALGLGQRTDVFDVGLHVVGPFFWRHRKLALLLQNVESTIYQRLEQLGL